MSTLVLAKSFLPDYARLDRSVQQKVDELFGKFREATHSGLHLEKYEGARDPRARTIRVDRHYRGIVMAPDSGDVYVLTRVLTHDDADKWMMRNVFGVNERTGALEVTDIVGVEAAAETLAQGAAADQPSLFAGVAPKTFAQLGIDAGLTPVLAKITSEEELDALARFLPEGQSDALFLLAAGYSPEQVWSELVANEPPETVDTEDLAAAAARPASQSMFYVVQGDDELIEMLNRPFDVWRTFLHPTQRRYAYRQFNGPVRVTGGAGTGKTVIAMHRARWLADEVVSHLEDDPTSRVLLTTYTNSLADSLQRTMETFCSPEAFRRIEVMTVDQLAYRTVAEVERKQLNVLSDTDIRRTWSDVVDELGLQFTPDFLDQEWRQVVMAQGIRSQADYFTAPRVGRGVRMSRRERADVWRGVEAFTSRLLAKGKVTFLQLSALAAAHLEARSVKPFGHVVVDEAQDLHPAQWRLLRAAVATGPNDLFIVGDTHQRIYDNRVSLSKLGIEVRGRSHRLRINYRTTQEILAWAVALLTGETFDDLDEGADTLIGYRSSLHGPPPTLAGYGTRGEELAALVEAVKDWIGAGVDPAAIGVAARTRDVLPAVEEALENAGLPVRLLADNTDGDGIGVGTMHRMKGMEFRCVAVVDAGAARLPLPAAVVQESVDPMQHAHDLQRERCLMYVACTRARDTLRVSWTGKVSPFLAGAVTGELG